jgi:hypothetical protein
MNMLNNLRMEASDLTDEFASEPSTGDAAKDRKDHHPEVGSHGAGFFISPLRQPRSRAELERAWKDSE